MYVYDLCSSGNESLKLIDFFSLLITTSLKIMILNLKKERCKGQLAFPFINLSCSPGWNSLYLWRGYSSVPRVSFDIYFGSCVWCYLPLSLDSSSAFDIFFTKQYHVNESFPVYLFIFVCKYIFSNVLGLVQFIHFIYWNKRFTNRNNFCWLWV